MEARREPSLPPTLVAIPSLPSYSLRSSDGRKNPMEGGGTLKILPPATLLSRRISRGLPQTGTNTGGGRASGDDNVEDDDDRSGS